MATLTLNLTKDDPKMILDISKSDNKIKCSMSWNQPAGVTQKLDLDIYAYLLNKEGKITSLEQVVYHRTKASANKAVTQPFDSLDGTKSEELFIYADLMPEGIYGVAVYAVLHDAVKRGHTFDALQNAMFCVQNSETSDVLANYRISDYPGQYCLHIGNFNLSANGGMEFVPAGVGGVLDGNQILQLYV